MTLRAPYVLEYEYRRSTGPVIGRFLGALKSKRIVGARTKDGRTIVPAVEYDELGQATTELVVVSDRGTITSWSFVAKPRKSHPTSSPFAWALIRLDGADTSLLHIIRVDDPSRIATGARVRAEWIDQPVGSIADIAHFVLDAGESDGE